MSYLNNVARYPEDNHVPHPRDRAPEGEQQSNTGAFNVEPPVIPSQSGDSVSSGADSEDGFRERNSQGEFEGVGHAQGQEHAPEKPGIGQRMKGNLEKVTGKAIGDVGMVEEGEQLKTGQSGSNF
ncbi:hypothetical protein OE88DRAFT_1661568 [Heliocybe sulcata]|uniref:Uncharacterized protein n=1 Tax=Heliocybe sulcata TaxID=5364 RepID=A0A5C3MWZ3_9AGAM|nr:hypothetical protein OE88DRAFT_1661568 [Heliocybe sulcata]